MNDPNLRSILDFAVEAAQLAGAFTLGYFNADTPHELKADRTPVTAADRGAEERLRRGIQKAFPGHGILGEEFGEEPGEEPARWILDPIDGTYSFISGVPLYSVLVGFEWRGEVLIGVIHLPALGETIYAARGLGCWWNGRRARVTNITDLAQARLVGCGVKGFYRCGVSHVFDRLCRACLSDRSWSDAYAYALVATGRAEIAVDPVMSIWDTAALLPVLLEAGGALTDWSGVQTHLARQVVASNGLLHSSVLPLFGTEHTDPRSPGPSDHPDA